MKVQLNKNSKKTEMLAVTWWSRTPCWVVWVAWLKIHKIFQKGNSRIARTVLVYIRSISQLSWSPKIMHTVGTYFHTLYRPTKAICQNLIFVVQTTVIGSIWSLLWCTMSSSTSNCERCHSSDFWGTKHFFPGPGGHSSNHHNALKLHTGIYDLWNTSALFYSSNRHHKGHRINFQKTNFNQNKKLLIINKFIKQWFSYINKLISVYQILITFNFMSMFTWVMKYNLFTYYNK